MLNVEGKHLDSVNVSTPDHMHASMGMAAMQRIAPVRTKTTYPWNRRVKGFDEVCSKNRISYSNGHSDPF